MFILLFLQTGLETHAGSCKLMHLLAGQINNTWERAKEKYLDAVWCDRDFIRFQLSDGTASLFMK
jgi:hypothetical protein